MQAGTKSLHILGSAAGGGIPQWNCACANCVEARRGSGDVRPRTQDTMALELRQDAFLLINASPDICRQIERTPALHPRSGRRSPIEGVVLTNGDLDHCLGLFSLRESTPLIIYATGAVWRGLTEHNAIFRTLQRSPDQVTWRRLELGRTIELTGRDAAGCSLTAEIFPLPGKVPKHLEGRADPSAEDNIGLSIRNARTGRRIVVATAFSAAGAWLARADGADICLFDGTFWSSDELPRANLSPARAEDMAHLPIGGPSGSLALLSRIRAARKIYTHINNSNPILDRRSSEHREVISAGWEIAEDGWELSS